MATRPLIPASVSSQLDDTGQERIHVAPIVTIIRAPYGPPPADCLTAWAPAGQPFWFSFTGDSQAPPESLGSGAALFYNSVYVGSAVISSDTNEISDISWDVSAPVLEQDQFYTFLVQWDGEGSLLGEFCVEVEARGV